MVGSKHAGVFFVMSLGISSSDIPTASRAAIFAMGKPVALLASAELRETRGFISITDRKSTRLNSSHSQISYAVFCLKKKKKLINNFSKKKHRYLFNQINSLF